MLIAIALILATKPFLMKAAQRRGVGLASVNVHGVIEDLGERRPWILPIVGAVVGFLVGLTSVGAGTMIIAALFFLYPRWDSRNYVGTMSFMPRCW